MHIVTSFLIHSQSGYVVIFYMTPEQSTSEQR